jgi:two-component system NtrC family sensor kinase
MLYEHNATSAFTAGALKAEGWYEFNGIRYYLFFEAAPVRNLAGEIIAAVETLEDITDRKLMEEKLSRLTRAVEQSPATIVMTDSDGNIEYVNPKFSVTTGYTFDEAIGQNPRILKSGELDASAYKELWDAVKSGREWRGEFHNKRKDGTLYWEFASISPLFDKDGNINGYLAVKEDITSRKEAEAELMASRHELQAQHEKLENLFQLVSKGKREWEETLDHLNDCVILTDDGHRVRRFNRLFAHITGKPYDELLGMDWRQLLAEAGFVFISFNGTSGELHHTRSARIFDIRLYEIKHQELLEGLVVSLNDTTELRETTKELEKAYAELKDAQLQIYQQEKMASIGQLAAGVAHEINNPMGFINSNLGSLDKYIVRISDYFRLIDDECRSEQSMLSAAVLAERKRLKIDLIIDDARQLIAESQDGAARVRRIVQDLKSFSRVDQSEQALVNLNEALETTINIAWNELKYVATLERQYGELPEVLCYPQQLNQVFLNLLVNAAHALGTSQGAITVKSWQEEDQVCVSVADTGCGIAPENLNRIFEPFFTTKEVGKGTGLGLSISFDIIKKHGGTIDVQSEVGSGTTFTVRLPVAGV